jgi:hypothetical protein
MPDLVYNGIKRFAFVNCAFCGDNVSRRLLVNINVIDHAGISH